MNEKLFKNRAEWREWLDKHHATDSEVWLVYYKKHCGKESIQKESIQYEEAVEEALCYGWIDSKVKRIDAEKYMQKYTPRQDKSNWSKSKKRELNDLLRGDECPRLELPWLKLRSRMGHGIDSMT